MNMLKTSSSLIAIMLMGTATAYAAPDDAAKTAVPAEAAATGTDKDGNVTFKDDAYITISGTVGTITDDDEFQLNHAGGVIDVDTNDAWPALFSGASTMLKAGDRVTVTGKVDNNLFDTNEIEAYRLTVSGTDHTRVYTNDKYAPHPDDDMAAYESVTGGANLKDDQKVRLSGTVSKIMDDDKFMLRYGNGEIKVDADDVEFTNAQRLVVGDEVIVFGEVDKELFSKKEIEADRVILSRDYSQMVR